MSSEAKQFFGAWNKDPDPTYTVLYTQRKQQCRPFSRNPFAPPESDTHQSSLDATSGGDNDKPPEEPGNKREDPVHSKAEDSDIPVLVNPGPAWVHLFYDLAWTATFASLTQNGKLNEPWDTLSYVTFFLVVWWLWVSQVMYNLHFYTNDWFHLVCIFLQLVIFGMLAATTRGFDVTTYIIHSPGVPDRLDPQTTDEITDPKRYLDERSAKISMRIIVISVAISRVILLIQYLRVLAYAHFTARLGARKGAQIRVPWKLYIIPIGLIISIPLFIAALVISLLPYGRDKFGAKLKFVFWGAALIVEVVSHIRMSRATWGRLNRQKKSNRSQNKNTPLDPELSPDSLPGGISKSILPIPRANFTLRSRLEAITTIILGEGINGIAGALYAIIATTGIGGPIISNLTCSALIIYFLAYLYFEGPTNYQDPKGKGRRQAIWLLLHLPFLLAIVLLLSGVKDQFLLTSFLSTADDASDGLIDLILYQEGFEIGDPDAVNNTAVKNYLLRRGISWSEEYNALLASLGPVNASEWPTEAQINATAVWVYRISLNVTVKIYETLMGGLDQVSNKTISDIEFYRNTTAFPLEDYLGEVGTADSFHYLRIITGLVKPNLQGARYIIALVGWILVLLGALSLVHSRPQDRFQWGIIMSRFMMGLFLFILLLLNIGRYQSLWVWENQKKQQAGVFQWLWAYWVLPTIAVALGTQFMIETILIWLATLRTGDRHKKSLGRLAWESLKQKVLGPSTTSNEAE